MARVCDFQNILYKFDRCFPYIKVNTCSFIPLICGFFSRARASFDILRRAAL